MFNKFSLRKKLLFSVLITCSLTGATSLYIYRNINSMMDAQRWVTHTNEVISKFEQIITYMVDMETGQRGFLMSGDKNFLEPYNNAITKIEPHILSLQKKVSDNSVQVERLDKIIKLKSQWLEIAVNYEMNSRSSFDSNQITLQEFQSTLKSAKGKEVMDSIRREVASGIQMEEDLKVKRKERSASLANISLRSLEFAVPISLFLGFGILYLVIIKLIQRMDFVLKGLDTAKSTLNTISTNVYDSSQELAAGATEQATSLNETSASIEQIQVMVENNAANAKEAGTKSNHSKEITLKGKEIVSSMIDSINDINQSNTNLSNQVKKSNDDLSKIVDVISEISDNTRIINEIVFQTKLLSFNASVEAARAGDNGKGFAVVAEEVGNLAQVSGTASNNISNMLDSSIKNVQAIIHETQGSVDNLIIESNDKVERGIHVAKKCEESLSEILENVQETSNLTNHITSATNEQTIGIREVTSAIMTLNNLTGKNANVSNSTASISKELREEVQSLNKMLFDLEVSIRGDQATIS